MRTSTSGSLLALVATALLMGAVYAASPPSDSVRSLKTIYTFPPYSYPGSFLQAPDGSFFGVTKYGQSAGFGMLAYGALYHLDTAGNFLTLHEFAGDTGAYPRILALAADGRLYGGSTGQNNLGSVYRIETNGAFQLLHEFTGGADGLFPNSLVAASDGNTYGFASGQFQVHPSSFFRILPDGTFEIIRTFQESDEITAASGLVEAANGEFYGFSYGSLFQISKQGATTILHNFPTGAGTAGLQPDSLTAGVDGNIYGTTPGAYWAWHGSVIYDNPGSIFQFTPVGEFQELHSFPYFGSPSAIVQANSGNIYGIRDRLSRVTVAGQFDELYFLGYPRRSEFLIEGINGDIYGTAQMTDGTNIGSGTLFRVVFGQPGAVNLSSRMQVGTGDSVAIGGFIITGSAAKKVLVRGIGSSLASLLPGSLPDPSLELHDGSGEVIARNDDWRVTQVGGVIAGDQSSEIQASGLAPAADRESALIATLQPGNYTAVVSGSQSDTGIGLYELYDLDIETDSRLGNISTRGLVESGNNVMIGGLIVDGSYSSPVNFVFRALGPSLSQSGTANTLQDPSLVIYNADGTSIATNDDWRDGQESELISLGLAPLDDRESAVIVSVSSGRYTAVVSAPNGATGIALVEVYDIP
jgi:uncharacterized repeat protein (TIGR03803 family)